ncbi:MAG: DNA repair protein RecN [Erysipelotrichia bacterium]|nr:DNA repair protein RecN [Erysipelotrichia bacterium]
MLIKLKVTNFAIIEDLEINFKPGLTVLTGETGAGKSLIIDCIGLLLGERAASEMIRSGEDKAVVDGMFDNQGPLIRAFLKKLDIPQRDGIIVIQRTISTTNKNVVKINDVTVTLGELRGLATLLADIHQQLEMVKLFNSENYLTMVDGFNPRLIKQYLTKYREAYGDLKKQSDKYQALVVKINEFNANQEQYEYAYQELRALDLKEGEETANENQISLLENYDKIYALLMENNELVGGESLNDLFKIKENLQKLTQYQDEYRPIYARLKNIYYETEDIYDTLKKKVGRLEYDPSLLDSLIERNRAINNIKKKYQKSVEELLVYQKELAELLNHEEDNAILLKEEEGKFIALYTATYQAAMDLHKVREQIAINVAKQLENTLEELALKCRFKIVVNAAPNSEDYTLNLFNENGIDAIEFYIETNIGEGMKPLAKVVSGGELSRIMLAIKILYIQAQKIQTIIFDEIDAGVSGDIANRVAKKIKELAINYQVITITHLPQVASCSDHHVKISKKVMNNRTYTTIKELTLDEKIHEIASLISAGKVTDKQLEYAKEMILNGQ